MQEITLQLRPGATGRFTCYLKQEDGDRIGASSVTAATITLRDAATATLIRNAGNVLALSEFQITDGTAVIDDATVDVTNFGWDILTTDSALVTSSAWREEHVGEFDFTYTDGGKTKHLLLRVRLQINDVIGLCTYDDVVNNTKGLVSDQLGAAEAQEPDRGFIEDLILATTLRAQHECRGRQLLVAASSTEYLSPRWGERIVRVERWPIGSVTSLTEDPDGAFTGVSAMAASDYYVDAADGSIELRFQSFQGGPGSVRVVHANSGLFRETGDVPMDLRAMAARQVAFLYSTRDTIGMSGRSMGGASVTIYATKDLLPEFKAALLPYRRRALFC